MAKILNSPNQNVAGEHLILLQDAITKIKQLVLKGASNEEINQVINNYVNKFVDPATKRAFQKSLIQSANKMMYQYNYNTNILNQSFIQKVVKHYNLGTGMTQTNQTYTIDLKAIYGEYLNKQIDQRKTIEEFRNRITDTKYGSVLIKNYDKQVKDQVKLLASEPAKYVAKDGRAISLRNKVEMAVRYEANQMDLAQYKQNGIKLVWTSSHADASPRCTPFQSKLWSLDGTSGIIDGHRYQPIEIALDANGGNSIINGYNCRHYLIEYEKGSTAPRQFTSKEIQKEYKIDQKQRLYENEIRHKKTMETLLRQQGFKEEASKMRKQWQNLNKRYEEYSIKNGRAFYRWRTLISDEERQKNIEIQIAKDLKEREIPNTDIVVVENTPPKPTHTVISGKNIVNTWQSNKEKFKFEIQDVINQQKFDGLPKVVSSKEFEKQLEKSPLILKRVYSASNEDILQAFKHELREGEWYVDCSEGGSRYGRGMYCVSSTTNTEEQIKLIDSEINLYKKGNEESGNIYSQVETMCLNENSKIINYKHINAEYGLNIIKSRKLDKETIYLVNKAEEYLKTRQEFEIVKEKLANGEAKQETFNLLKAKMQELRKIEYGGIFVQDIYNEAVTVGSKSELDQGVKATLLGYDAITVQGASATRDTIDYTIVLNRTKLIIKGDD